MTQTTLILGWLEQGNSITSLEALQRFGVFRLASRISELSKMGYQIVSETVKDGDKHYSKYFLYAK